MKDKYSEILLEIFNDAISKNELISESIELVPSIFATIEGFFIVNDDSRLILEYINSLFKILEKKGVI